MSHFLLLLLLHWESTCKRAEILINYLYTRQVQKRNKFFNQVKKIVLSIQGMSNFSKKIEYLPKP